MTPRRATPPDAASIHEIELLAAHKPWALADVHTHLAMPHGVTWVASHGVHIVGHVLATALFEEGEIF